MDPLALDFRLCPFGSRSPDGHTTEVVTDCKADKPLETLPLLTVAPAVRLPFRQPSSRGLRESAGLYETLHLCMNNTGNPQQLRWHLGPV